LAHLGATRTCEPLPPELERANVELPLDDTMVERLLDETMVGYPFGDTMVERFATPLLETTAPGAGPVGRLPGA
jgi:hypothetical protein